MDKTISDQDKFFVIDFLCSALKCEISDCDNESIKELSEIGKYGLIITPNKEEYLSEKEINRICLGDTRVLSMIGMMLSGGTPTQVMIAAGHTKVETGSYYYTNLEQFAHCIEHSKYLGIGTTSDIVSFNIPTNKIVRSKKSVPLENGRRCYNEKAVAGDYSDCFKYSGPMGEIGYCQQCPFCYSEKAEEELYRDNLKWHCNAFVDAINSVRRGYGNTGEIIEALNNIATDYNNLHQKIREELNNAHEEHERKKNNDEK